LFNLARPTGRLTCFVGFVFSNHCVVSWPGDSLRRLVLGVPLALEFLKLVHCPVHAVFDSPFVHHVLSAGSYILSFCVFFLAQPPAAVHIADREASPIFHPYVKACPRTGRLRDAGRGVI